MKYTAAFAAIISVVACAPNSIIDLGDGVKLIPREPRAGVRAERLREHRRGLMQIDNSAEIGSKNNSDVSYSTNWSGAVKIGTGLSDVTGTIVSVFDHASLIGICLSIRHWLKFELGCAYAIRSIWW